MGGVGGWGWCGVVGVGVGVGVVWLVLGLVLVLGLHKGSCSIQQCGFFGHIIQCTEQLIGQRMKVWNEPPLVAAHSECILHSDSSDPSPVR